MRGNQTTKADYVKRLSNIIGDNPKLHEALVTKEGKYYEFIKGIFYTHWSQKFFDRIVKAYLEGVA